MSLFQSKLGWQAGCWGRTFYRPDALPGDHTTTSKH